eukprot:366031-Chlamydomonas_euryale.AAC.11
MTYCVALISVALSPPSAMAAVAAPAAGAARPTGIPHSWDNLKANKLARLPLPLSLLWLTEARPPTEA